MVSNKFPGFEIWKKETSIPPASGPTEVVVENFAGEEHFPESNH